MLTDRNKETGSLGRISRNLVYLAAATRPQRSHKSWNSFKHDWTTWFKTGEENNPLWAKRGRTGGRTTSLLLLDASTNTETYRCAGTRPSSHNGARLPVSPRAGIKPKNLKAELLLRSWWPAERFLCRKSMRRAAVLDLLGGLSLPGPPFYWDI